MEKINQDFDYIKINLASPDRIKFWGERILPNGEIVGEVTKPETINYRTFKPEMDGLFCEKIFGPIKSWECHCGRYKQLRYKGIICERCGVEVTDSKVRRHRMGYIELLAPVTHVWYLKGVPSYLSRILNKKVKELEQIVYFNEEIIEEDVFLFDENMFEDDNYLIHEDDFILKRRNQKSGSQHVLAKLKELDLENELQLTRDIINNPKATTLNRKKALQRIRVIESFLATHTKPEWMVLTVLPIIPPGLRPMVQLEGGRFATSDLNELYRRVITRNNRLSRLLSIYAPDIVIRSEKRMLQEAVDALIDNGKRGPKTVDMNNRPLKSLADTVEGKQGRFRQNLLGKRVDYSARSVIIVGPDLELHQCGLPYEIAIELFQPFIVYELIKQGLAATIRMAKKVIQNNEQFTKYLLKKVLAGHPILLNRAPTLHRLGIQAFEPVLVKGRAIKLHPLVCPAFNADFDGDQMAVHLPLSLEAQIEARYLMLAPNNFLSPATGEPIIQPSQDMLLGCYYLTVANLLDIKGSGHYFSNFEDVLLAYEQHLIDMHALIWVRCPSNYEIVDELKIIKTVQLPNNRTLELYKNLQIYRDSQKEIIVQYLKTTAGRILFNNILNETIKL